MLCAWFVFAGVALAHDVTAGRPATVWLQLLFFSLETYWSLVAKSPTDCHIEGCEICLPHLTNPREWWAAAAPHSENTGRSNSPSPTINAESQARMQWELFFLWYEPQPPSLRSDTTTRPLSCWSCPWDFWSRLEWLTLAIAMAEHPFEHLQSLFAVLRLVCYGISREIKTPIKTHQIKLCSDRSRCLSKEYANTHTVRYMMVWQHTQEYFEKRDQAAAVSPGFCELLVIALYRILHCIKTWLRTQHGVWSCHWRSAESVDGHGPSPEPLCWPWRTTRKRVLADGNGPPNLVCCQQEHQPTANCKLVQNKIPLVTQVSYVSRGNLPEMKWTLETHYRLFYCSNVPVFSL